MARRFPVPVSFTIAHKHTAQWCHRFSQARHQSSRTNGRYIHTTQSKQQDAEYPMQTLASPLPTQEIQMSPLAHVPLSQVLRTCLITSVSSSPTLLRASTSMLQSMLESKNALMSIDRNPLVRAILWHTFYLQFCAGETPTQVRKTCNDLRNQGYGGVILEYALEVLKDAEGDAVKDVETWRQGVLDTVDMATEGDFVGLKWSGMGVAAMRLMKANAEPDRKMNEAMHAVCKAAAAKDVSLLPAAEETWSLDGFFSWSMGKQKVYNVKGNSVVYNTYQAYLKQIPGLLAKHLEEARQSDFTLGIKLVRGAYLGSEVRDLIHPSIEATHAAYDDMAAALIQRKYNTFLEPSATSTGLWPRTNVVLATHNAISVGKAQTLRRAQAAQGIPLTELAFAQLQGMADEVSCGMIAQAKASGGSPGAVQERVVKCTTWGSMYQCLNYLLRRAAENKDAAGRTIESRKAAQAEIGRRLQASIGLV